MTTFFEQPGVGGFGTIDGLQVGDFLRSSVGAPPSLLDGTGGDAFDDGTLNLTPGATYTFSIVWLNLAQFLTVTVSDGANADDILASGGLEQATKVNGGDIVNVPTLSNGDPAEGGTGTPAFITFTVPESGQVNLGITARGVAATDAPVSGGEIVYELFLSEIVLPTDTIPTDGDDVIMGGDAPTTLDLLDGDDTWTGVSETETFVTGVYTDTIDGGLGNDSIFGGLGNDKISGGRDDDLLDLGDGNDNAWGGEGDDVLFGGTGLDRLNGNSGDDSIFGGKGGDIIRGGKGEDYIEGGNQSDQIFGGAQSDEIYGGTGHDVIRGGLGADLIFGGSGADDINGGQFDDTIYGDHGDDLINGGSGDDEIYGGVSDDKINGNSGDDILFGDAGDDDLTGGSGADTLDGGSQTDNLNGGGGDDILFGGLGDDELTGGADADIFIFEGTVNHDVITDFAAGTDQIDLSAYNPVDMADAVLNASQTDAGALIDLGGDGSILLTGVSAEALDLADFILAEGLDPVDPGDLFEVF